MRKKAGRFFPAEELIEEGLFKNEEAVKELSPSLSSIEKDFLYIEYKKDAVAPFCLNLFVGYGIGSFVQNDITGGVIALSGDVLSGVLAFTGYMIASPVVAKYKESNYSPDFDWTPYTWQLLVGGACMLTGGICATGFTIFSCVRAFSYASRYNGTLKSALQGGEKKMPDSKSGIDLAVMPMFDISESRPGLVVRISF